MKTKKFWIEAVERAVKTAAQVAVLALTVGDEIGFDVISADWGDTASLAAGGFILSILTSIISAPVGPNESPSLVN